MIPTGSNQGSYSRPDKASLENNFQTHDLNEIMKVTFVSTHFTYHSCVDYSQGRSDSGKILNKIHDFSLLGFDICKPNKSEILLVLSQ
jgi:hypothetical protein